MAQVQQYDNQGNPIKKKPFKIKIAGFSFSLGQIIAVVVIIGIICLISFAQSKARERADQEDYEKRMAEMEAMMGQLGNQQTFDLHAQIQAQLTAQYGEAPEGFEWGYTGELVPLGNDDEHNCEDVVYMFLRAVSILDFSTAERYSSGSSIISSYQAYYGIVTESITDYYRNFLRKQYKSSLTSLEIEGISDVAVFADGTEYLTITIKCLDLSDKDFWEKDRDELFAKMRVYKETETDSVKTEQFVYDYLTSKYENGEVGKKSHTIELVVSKESGAGWLVSGDKELDAYLQYENGVDVARYILNEFSDWYMNIIMEEQLGAIGAVGDGLGGANDEYSGEGGELYEAADGGDENWGDQDETIAGVGAPNDEEVG